MRRTLVSLSRSLSFPLVLSAACRIALYARWESFSKFNRNRIWCDLATLQKSTNHQFIHSFLLRTASTCFQQNNCKKGMQNSSRPFAHVSAFSLPICRCSLLSNVTTVSLARMQWRVIVMHWCAVCSVNRPAKDKNKISSSSFCEQIYLLRGFFFFFFRFSPFRCWFRYTLRLKQHLPCST